MKQTQKTAGKLTVSLKVYGSLRPLLGKELKLEISGNTLGDLVEELARQKGKEIKEELLDEEGRLDYAYLLFADGNRVTDLSTVLPDNAALTITNQFGGGEAVEDSHLDGTDNVAEGKGENR